MSSLLESALKDMAFEVASKCIPMNCVLGLGSGSAVAIFARALGERNEKTPLGLRVVPSSMQAWLLARENRLPIHEDSARCPGEIDVAVDGADQVSTETRSIIKGGGGALFREKIILSSARKCYILGDERKFVSKLDRSVPVEVAQFALLTVEKQIRAELKAEPALRKLDKGYPFYTENGNIILDCQFPEPIKDPQSIERSLKLIAGVLEAGVFNMKIERFYKANLAGTFDSI
ncbi:MAG: ribose 5-phosphate isomerase A [Nitrososphaerales archaeon]